MSDIKDLDIEALLPDSISEDKKAKAIAEAVTNQLLEINRNINQILIWDDISKHDDNTLHGRCIPTFTIHHLASRQGLT